MFLENVSRDILEPFKIYNAVEANGHSGKRTFSTTHIRTLYFSIDFP